MNTSSSILLALLASIALVFPGGVAAEDTVAGIQEAIAAGEYENALELARTLSASAPLADGIPEAVFKGAAACVAKNELETAAAFYRLYLDKFPDAGRAVDARAELVGCYNALRELEKCIAQAQINLETDPDSRWVEYWRFLIGQSHFRLWDFETAEPLLEECLEKYPDGEYSALARKYLGWIEPDWEVDDNGLILYDSKLREDIRLQAAVKDLADDMEAGFRVLEERLGIDLRPHARVLVKYEDSGPRTKPGLRASTYIVARDNAPTIVMRFYTEFVVSRPDDYRQTVTHELKHAGFKGAMGQGYENLPEWIKEGLAVWGADDVETRLQLVLCNKITGGKDPFSALDGIEDGDYDEVDYMENALAFEWLEGKKAGNVKAFCRELIAGRPYREVWEELSGLPYQAALAEVDAHCRKRVAAALGDSLGEFRALRKASEKALNAGEAAAKTWVEAGGREEFEGWIKENVGHPAEPLARLCLARVLARAGEGKEGRKLLEHILEHDSLRCTLLDDAQFWIGISYNWEKDFIGTRDAFGVLLRDYPASHSAKRVAGKFQPAGPVTE